MSATKKSYRKAVWRLLAGAALLGAVMNLPAKAEQNLQARAIVKANAEATVSVSLSARIKALPFRAGQSFKKGDTVVSFDCDRFQADLRARQAIFSARQHEVKANRRLLRHQAIGANEVAVSVAQMEEAKALVDGQRALVKQCNVKAPFDGQMVERFINAHETPGANQPLIKIVDTSKTELELIVPSRWLVWLKKGSGFVFQVDETGARLQAKILRLGAVVDPVSQTIKITAVFSSNKMNEVLPGMSGTATFAYTGS